MGEGGAPQRCDTVGDDHRVEAAVGEGGLFNGGEAVRELGTLQIDTAVESGLANLGDALKEGDLGESYPFWMRKVSTALRASPPMTEAPTVTEASLLQPRKASVPTVSTVAGMVTSVRLVQAPKALGPISCMLSGMVT